MRYYYSKSGNIQKCINEPKCNSRNVFFDSPGGIGKLLFIYLHLLKIRNIYSITLATATLGIAATLLEGGKTAHRIIVLKLLLILNKIETLRYQTNKQSNLFKVLHDYILIIWDEKTMSDKMDFEIENNSEIY